MFGKLKQLIALLSRIKKTFIAIDFGDIIELLKLSFSAFRNAYFLKHDANTFY